MSVETRKVGIVTLHGYSNYGNRLQNYALQEQIKALGFDVDTLVFQRSETKFQEGNLQKVKNISGLPFKEIEKRVRNKFRGQYNKLINYINRDSIVERTRIFKEFSSDYLSEKYFDHSAKTLMDLGDCYDFFITGSDQVWNPNFIKGLEDVFFLGFVKPCKKFSYAASFGIDQLPKSFEGLIRDWLFEMKSISVREDSGARIISEITGRESVISLDPTLLLDKKSWLSIAKEAYKPSKKFILTYFLGKRPSEAARLIEDLSQNYELEIVNLGDFKNKKVYQTGPQEFIDYLRSAEVVLTDSFHGVVFSILMETPFVAFKRIGGPSMFSRIETLLGLVGLGERESNFIQKAKEVFEVDFTEAKRIISRERNKAKEYLENNLKESR